MNATDTQNGERASERVSERKKAPVNFVVRILFANILVCRRFSFLMYSLLVHNM